MKALDCWWYSSGGALLLAEERKADGFKVKADEVASCRFAGEMEQRCSRLVQLRNM